MQIRPVRDDDFDAIATITNHYIVNTATHFATEPVTASELRANWLLQRDRHPFLVADDGAVVGYAKSGTFRERAAYAWTCEVGLYLDHAARGKGIGTILYTELLNECARLGFRSAVAVVVQPNAASLKLHERLGFVSAGVIRDAGWKHGAWHDVAFFQKLLATGPTGPAVEANLLRSQK